MNQQVYWHTTVQSEESKLTPIPKRVDVLIIGAGYTGLSAARTLAKRGANTAVLEAEIPGWGASSRNGGMTLTGLKPSMQKVMRTFGRDLTKEFFQYSLRSVDTVEQIINEEKIDCGFARSGHLVVANKATHFDDLKTQAAFMAKEFSHEVRLIDRKDLHQEIGSEIYHGALVDHASGGLNPAQFVAGLAKAAQTAGATLCTRARVVALERKENHFAVQTERGSLHADSVLIATSGYTGSITKNLQKRIIPIGSFIIATERLSDKLASELSPKNRMIFDCRHFLNYYRLWDNRLIFGGRAAFFPENPNTIPQSGEILKREMIRIYPQLQNTSVEYVWGGTLDFAFDIMPHVGQMDGLYYSLGYAGHGVAMGTHLGMKVAEAMLKGNVNDIPFARYSFPGAPLGLYNGRPWFLPLAWLWYRFLDFIE